MNPEMPYALIIGSDHFVAKKLAEEIAGKDINVVEIEDYIDLGDLPNIKGNFSYVFDFRCEVDLWNDTVKASEKITLIKVNSDINGEKIVSRLKNSGLNWRFLEAGGVYGPGMDIDEDNLSVGFLVRAFRLAVANKNLILPPINYDFRLLETRDLVDAILRASFLSGMEEEMFLLAGDKTNSKTVAALLINEAKMTRVKVMPKDIAIFDLDEEKLEESCKKLRWKAKIDFSEGIRETLQYFFSKIDEESRKPALNKLNTIKKTLEAIDKEKEELRKRIFEVVVEEPKMEEKKEIEIKPEELEIEDEQIEEIEEIKPFISKAAPLIIEEEMEEEKEIVQVEPIVKESVVKKEPEVIKVKKDKNYFWVLPLIFVLLMISVPVSWGLSTYMAVNNIKKIETLITTKKYLEAKNLSNKYINKTNKIDEDIDDLGLNRFAFLRNYQFGLKAINESLVLENKLIDVASAGDAIDGAIFNDKKIDWDKQLTSVKNNLADINSEIGVLQARLSGDWSWLPADWKSSLQKKTTDLNKIKIQLASASQAVKILPEFLGLDGTKREYLVLLQNETELRPGGGFIGSYGLLSFQNGKLLAFDIKDVYEADGQLVGHVEPPAEIKSYLGEAGWFMRDANWNANFPDATVDLKWFLEKETGKKVDGVIGVNLAVARAVLGAVGEVYVPDFKEKINKNNLYEQAEFYSENRFFPGSIQKASFLGALGKQLFESIRNLKMDQKMNLMTAVLSSLDKNDIQIVLNQKEAQQTIFDLGWDGSIYQGKCGTENCISDYLYLVEANLGVNKANYFLYRNIEESIDISNQVLSRDVKIKYENTAKNTNPPGGDYKNYLRVYLPKDINLSEISLTDGNNLTSRKVYNGDEIKVREVNGKQEVGFLVTVPVSQKRIVEIKYSTNIDLSTKNKFSYVNYVQKQSGFGDTGIVSLISYPPEYQPTQVQPVANLVSGNLLFNQKLDGDIKMGVQFEK